MRCAKPALALSCMYPPYTRQQETPVPKQCGKLSGLRQMIYFGNHVHESDLPVIGHVLRRYDNVPQIPEFGVVGFPGSRGVDPLHVAALFFGIEQLFRAAQKGGQDVFRGGFFGGRKRVSRPVRQRFRIKIGGQIKRLCLLFCREPDS